MTAETVSPAIVLAEHDQTSPPLRPGRCRVHLSILETHRDARVPWYAWEDPATVCVLCLREDPAAGDRCTWCGDRLTPEGTPTWRVSPRRKFCSPLHRLHAHRKAGKP